MLSAVVERLLKAMREIHPETPRQFFALANRHMRWELNDLARRLDQRTQAMGLYEDAVPAPETSGSVLGPDAISMLEAIENLPDEEREVFELIRIQGFTQTESAELIGVSAKTVQREWTVALAWLRKEVARDLELFRSPA